MRRKLHAFCEAESKQHSVLFCISQSDMAQTEKFSVSMRLGETPVPIPNTMVKPYTADGTALATVWESRWTPNQILFLKPNKNNPKRFED